MEIPEKFKDMVSKIESMSVMDLAELVKVLEDKFGVSAMAAPTFAAGAPTPPVADVGVEEKTSFTVELKDGGAQKIQVIKVVREVLGLGLKDTKDLVDGAPKVVKENAKKEEAEELKKKI